MHSHQTWFSTFPIFEIMKFKINSFPVTLMTKDQFLKTGLHFTWKEAKLKSRPFTFVLTTALPQNR